MRIINFILLFGIIGCNGCENSSTKLAESNLFLEQQETFDSANHLKTTNESEIFYNDFEITPQDSLFFKLNLELKEITEQEFNNYERNYKRNCQIDSSGFISGKGLTLDTECHEICITSILEMESDEIMNLPCTYDQGILGLAFSTSCDQFVTYSCYDSPNYDNFYEYRSELIGFKISKEKGLGCIKPFFKYYTKDWSIAELIWITDKKITIKVYTEGIPSKGNDFHFKYYITEI